VYLLLNLVDLQYTTNNSNNNIGNRKLSEGNEHFVNQSNNYAYVNNLNNVYNNPIEESSDINDFNSEYFQMSIKSN